MDRNRRLLDSIARAVARCVPGEDARPAFAPVLADLLALTDSDAGFLGASGEDESARSHLELLAVEGDLADGAPLAAALRSAERALASPGGAPDERPAPTPGERDATRPFLMRSLRVGGRVVGFVGLAGRPGGYDDAVAHLLDPLLGVTAAQIEAWRAEVSRTRVEAALGRRTELAGLVRRISRTLIESERDDIVESALRDLALFVGAQRISFFRQVDEGRIALRSHQWDAASHVNAPRAFPVAVPTDTIANLIAMLNRGELVFVPDVSAPPAAVAAELAPFAQVGIRSQAWLPAQQGDAVVGAVAISWLDRPARIEHADLESLAVVADLFASTVSRRDAEQALRRRIEIGSFVLDLSSRFLDVPIERVDAAIEDALASIARFVGATRAVLGEVSGSPSRIEAVHSAGFTPGDPSSLPSGMALGTLPLAEQLSDTRRAALVSLDRIPPDSSVATAMRAIGASRAGWLTALDHGKRAGAIVLYWRAGEAAPAVAELEALSVLADRLVAVLRRKRADLALRESESRFRAMADSTPLLIWTIDVAGRATFVNRACERFAGRSGHELLGLAPIVEVHPDERATLVAALRSAAEHRTAFEFDCRARRADGQWRSLHSYNAPLLGPDGSLRGFVGSSVDLTDHQRLEAELRQALKLEAVGRLAGGIAHDFNNLLTAVIGHLDCARDTLAQGGLPLRDLDEVEAAANRAASLTRQLLAFARRQRIESRVVDLNDVVAGVEQLLRRLIGEHVRLDVRLDPDAGRVRVDTGQLEQVLVNLAVNARDSMPAGGTLRIESARVEEPQAAWVRITVADTGSGMDEETLAHAFEPFFTTKDVGKGTGLGLATCYGIIAQSGGQIAVDSELGVGTTFEILLPAADDSELDEDEPAAPAPQVSAGRETILLVEDEPAVRSLAARVLRGLGYHVFESADGSAAVQRSDLGPIDLVVTDMVMPGRSGPEVARWARTVWPGVRVLFISGYTDSLADDATIAQRGFAFLAKPFTPQQLATRVRALLDETDVES